MSKEVAILGVSLFVFGLGLGPLVATLGDPISEIYRRNVVYRVSFSLFFTCMFRVVSAPRVCPSVYVCYVTLCLCILSWIWWDNPIHADTCLLYMTFQFICEHRGSAFLSVAGRSVCDMFSNPAKRTRGACQPDNQSQFCPCLNESILAAEFPTITLSSSHRCKPVLVSAHVSPR